MAFSLAWLNGSTWQIFDWRKDDLRVSLRWHLLVFLLTGEAVKGPETQLRVWGWWGRGKGRRLKCSFQSCNFLPMSSGSSSRCLCSHDQSMWDSCGYYNVLLKWNCYAQHEDLSLDPRTHVKPDTRAHVYDPSVPVRAGRHSPETPWKLTWVAWHTHPW